MGYYNNRKKVIVGYFVIMFLILFGLIALPSGIASLYKWNYYVDLTLLSILLILYYGMVLRGKADAFSPLTFFSIIYFMMFFVTPMYDVAIGQIQYWGVDVFDYGIEGSVLAFVGYLCFLLAYAFDFTIHRKSYSYDSILQSEFFDHVNEDTHSTGYLMLYIRIGYFVSLAANIWYMVHSLGSSILYILTLGLLGSGGTTSEVSNIGFVSMLSFCLLSFTLLYVEYGKHVALKILAVLLAVELQVARGFRFYIIQIAMMFISYYFIRTKKKVKVWHIILLVLIVLIPVVLMTLFRNTIRAGSGMDLSSVNGNSINDALNQAIWDNLRIYKNYYGVLKVVPSETPFLFGTEMILYTIVMFVPRAIWPGKPNPPGAEASRIAFGQVAVDGGTAYPNLGEYYYNFGVFGIILFMFLFGLIMKKAEERFRYKSTSKVDLMIYCTMLGIILQFIIRGYMPSNFWMLIFSLLPYWGTKVLLT